MSDPRTMNRMDNEVKVTHARLERWGMWAKTSGVRAWPQVTLLGRIIEQGPVGAAIPTSAAITAIPKDIQEVDAAVSHLCEIDKLVIRTYYLEWAPMEVMARHRRMSVAKFRNCLTRARWRVTGYLRALVDLEENLKTASNRDTRRIPEFAA